MYGIDSGNGYTYGLDPETEKAEENQTLYLISQLKTTTTPTAGA